MKLEVLDGGRGQSTHLQVKALGFNVHVHSPVQAQPLYTL